MFPDTSKPLNTQPADENQPSGLPPQRPADWRITIDIPVSVPLSERDRLYTVVQEVLHNWEPADRDGWDAHLGAGPADHTVEAYAERLEKELEDIRAELATLRPTGD